MGEVLRVVGILVAVLTGIVAFWLFPLKLLVKLHGGRSAPCPHALAWLVNNPLRRWDMRHTLDRIAPRSGEVVLELGPGPGVFTLETARRIAPTGKLIAVDIQPKMIAEVESKVRSAGVSNVETHVAGAYELPLADGGVDRAFLVTVLAEIPDPVKALRELYRVLRPEGILSITEEFYDPDYPRRATTERWAAAAGFELAERHGSFWVYTLNFRKPA